MIFEPINVCDLCARFLSCPRKKVSHSMCPNFVSIKDAQEKLIAASKKKESDNVNHPSHYETGKFESIDVMVETQGKEAVQAFCMCNAFKYIYRHKFKNGVEDIRKAKWYLDKYLELEDEK